MIGGRPLNYYVFMSSKFYYFRLEKEYTTIKSKEMEEQVEIKVSAEKHIEKHIEQLITK